MDKYVTMFISDQVDRDDSLFTYPTGKSYHDYNDASFTPIMFNKDLTVFIPDATKRQNAISICNNGATTDSNPAERRECYYDFALTDNAEIARTTAVAGAISTETVEIFSRYTLLKSPSQ